MNLRELIQEVAKDGPSDPRELTALVLARIPRKDQVACLEAALPHMIRSVVLDRTQVPIVTPEVAAARGSVRQAEQVAMWRRQLGDRYCIANGKGWLWMRLGEMTYEQVVAAAEVRYRDAARVRAAGDYLMAVASAVETMGANVVADLPEPVLRELAGKQAAA